MRIADLTNNGAMQIVDAITMDFDALVATCRRVPAEVDHHFACQVKNRWALSGTEARLLIALIPGGTTGAELAQQLVIDAGAISKMLARLENARYVERARSTTDRRTVNSTLTDSGRTVAIKLNVLWKHSLRVAFNRIDALDNAQLLQLVSRISAHVVELRPASSG